MAPAISIIEAQAVHSDIVADLHARSFRRGWTADECEALLTDRRVVGLLAVRSGLLGKSPVGFVLAREAAGEAEILSIGVEPRARKAGTGRALLSYAIGHLRVRGVDNLFLEVEEDNFPALRLYDAFGFEERGRRESYYRKENGEASAAIVMGLDLQQF